MPRILHTMENNPVIHYLLNKMAKQRKRMLTQMFIMGVLVENRLVDCTSKENDNSRITLM